VSEPETTNFKKNGAKPVL